jgi:hypothetical protein
MPAPTGRNGIAPGATPGAFILRINSFANFFAQPKTSGFALAKRRGFPAFIPDFIALLAAGCQRRHKHPPNRVFRQFKVCPQCFGRGFPPFVAKERTLS